MGFFGGGQKSSSIISQWDQGKEERRKSITYYFNRLQIVDSYLIHCFVELVNC